SIGGNAVVSGGIAGKDGENSDAYGGNIAIGGNKANTISGDAMILGGVAPRYGGSIAFGGSDSLSISGNAVVVGGRTTGSLAGGNICTTSVNTLGIFENAKILGGSSADGGNISVNDTTSAGNGKKAVLKIYGNAIVTGGTASNTGSNVRMLEQNNASSLEIADNASVGGTYTLNDERSTDYNGTYSGGDIYLRRVTDLAITGGYVSELSAHSSLSPAGFISGGCFMEEPSEAWICGGKAVMMGSFGNANTQDTALYHYTVDDRANGALIDVDSEIEGGMLVMTTGSGLYKKGETFTLTVSVPSGFTFEGWYENGAVCGTDTTYTGVAEQDTVIVAKLAIDEGSVSIAVTSRGNFTVTIGGLEYHANGSYTGYAARGEEIRILYEGTAPFVAWVNASDRILSKAPDYSFIAYADAAVKSSVETILPDQAAVVFFTEYDQIYRMLYAIRTDSEFTMPETPFRLGRTVVWDKTAAEIMQEARESDSVFVHAVVYEASTDYTITVKSGSETIFTKTVLLGDQARIELPEENFCYVKDISNRVLSYQPVFYMKADANVTLTAVYGSEPVERRSVVSLTVAKREDKNVTFTASRSILESDEVAEQGILFSKVEMLSSLFVKGAENVRASIGVETGRIGTTTVNITKVPTDTVLYAKAYVILKDGRVIYSDIVKLEAGNNGTIHLPEIPF
ncbi:MAG: hypothetical protein J5794_08595, partial [Lachnospiraceae bacterium]|nr:hypothetical protein [Lachnospiraceae bacterium]